MGTGLLLLRKLSSSFHNSYKFDCKTVITTHFADSRWVQIMIDENYLDANGEKLIHRPFVSEYGGIKWDVPTEERS